MNRIEIRYTSNRDNICSNLQIYNDIKGFSCDKLGYTFYGQEADIMLEYFKHAVIKNNDKVMNYGVYVDGECICCLNEDEEVK